MPIIRPTLVTLEETDDALISKFSNISITTLEGGLITVPVFLEVAGAHTSESAKSFPRITIELVDISEERENQEASDDVYEYEYNNTVDPPQRIMHAVPEPVRISYRFRTVALDDFQALRTMQQEMIKILGRDTYLSLPVAASQTNWASPTYNLSGSETLTIQIDGGSTQTITFQAGDFAIGGSATITEVITRINTDIVGAIASSSNNQIVLTSDTLGDDSSIQITGGTANSELKFSTHLSYGGNRDLWMFQEGSIITIKEPSADQLILQNVWNYDILAELESSDITTEKVVTDIQFSLWQGIDQDIKFRDIEFDDTDFTPI